MLCAAGSWIKWKLGGSHIPTGAECVLSPEGLLRAQEGLGDQCCGPQDHLASSDACENPDQPLLL